MTSYRFKSRALIIMLTVVLFGVPSEGFKLDQAGSRTDEYIEVHGPGTTFVPFTTKYVKYDGEIRKVSKFSIVLEAGALDCQCPHCCNGECYIVVLTEIIVAGNPMQVPAIIWLPCSSS